MLQPQSQPSPLPSSSPSPRQIPSQQPNSLKYIKYYSPFFFILIGFICTIIYMFLFIISVSNKLSLSLLTQCSTIKITSSILYLYNIKILQILFIVLDAISIVSYSIILLLTIYIYIRRSKIQTKILLILQSIYCIVVYIIILSIGSNFGNCLKILININSILWCTVNNSQYIQLVYIYNSMVSCTIIQGIGLFCGIVLLFNNFSKILFKEYRVFRYYQQQNVKIDSNKVQQYNKIEKQKQKHKQSIQQITSHHQLKQYCTQTQQLKKPRIFGRQFIAKSQVKTTPSTKGKVYQVDSSLMSNYYTPYKQLPITNQQSQRKNALILEDKLSITQKQDKPKQYKQYKESKQSKQNKQQAQNKQKQKQQKLHISRINYSKIQSNLINIDENGPPLQLGQIVLENKSKIQNNTHSNINISNNINNSNGNIKNSNSNININNSLQKSKNMSVINLNVQSEDD